MAARTKYPPVPVQLTRLVGPARARGLSFEEFWQEAVRPGLPPVTWRTPPARRPEGCVVWPNDTDDRANAREVHADPNVIDGWRRAYEEKPPRRRDTALRLLAPLIDGQAVTGYEADRGVASAS